MLAYRYLTSIDDAAFCHRVTAALSSGWELYGEPSLTYDPARGAVICGQGHRQHHRIDDVQRVTGLVCALTEIPQWMYRPRSWASR